MRLVEVVSTPVFKVYGPSDIVPATKAMLMAEYIDFGVELREVASRTRPEELLDIDRVVIKQLLKKEIKHKPNSLGSAYIYCTLEGARSMKRVLDELQAHFNSAVWPWVVTVDREIHEP